MAATSIPSVVVVLLSLYSSASPGFAQQPGANYDESQVGTYTLPDPLTFSSGKPVRTPKDWLNKRRPELLQLFADDIYGHSPKPAKAHFEIIEETPGALNGTAIRKQIRVHFSSRPNAPTATVLVYIPSAAQTPVPAILSLNFMGNQSVVNDPAVPLPMIWTFRTHQHIQASEESRGKGEFQVDKILAHGYAFATIYYQDLEPDFKGGYELGIRPLFLKPGETAPATDAWGAIAAWSYGLSRALDYLETDKAIDSKHVAVMGHSRLGKAVLWAGALDQRFAIVLASCPGEGGASLARRHYGEELRNLAGAFPYWFDANFQKFANRPETLPVDMHELIALSAPRPVYITAAEDDKWSDPKGEFLACVAAGPVYRLLGQRGLETDVMPALNQPIMHTLGFHYRTGKHEVTSFDWDQFLAFARMHWKSR